MECWASKDIRPGIMIGCPGNLDFVPRYFHGSYEKPLIEEYEIMEVILAGGHTVALQFPFDDGSVFSGRRIFSL